MSVGQPFLEELVDGWRAEKNYGPEATARAQGRFTGRVSFDFFVWCPLLGEMTLK
jgi:hypothetical protein